MANASAYAATKAAVSSIGRVAATELVAKKIRVNVVSPGPINTPILGKSDLPQEAVQGIVKALIAMVPQGRMGDAAEVANTVLFLASDDASFITGVELLVDGGAGLRR
jgi:NAD(P)-dependent dehydrogenase (short-subunit alcohol dehydrogenase family)